VATWSLRGRLDAGRTVRWSGTDWTADKDTTAALNALHGGPFGAALLTPVGPVYQPHGPRDDVALYLNAAALMPGGPIVDGTPPTTPAAPAVPDGAVS
jgi:hypothetical protein